VLSGEDGVGHGAVERRGCGGGEGRA
jgi:hypothetical protein